MPKLPFGDKGPCEVIWNYGESGAMLLGSTLGGVTLNMETEVSDINEDQEGTAAVDAIHTGSTVTLEATFTRSSLEQIAEMLNTAVEDGQIVPIENQIGCDMYDEAKAIVLKPLCGNVVSDDPAEWIHLYRCYPIPGFELPFDVDTQRTIPITFKVFVSQESGETGRFGTLGMAVGSPAM